MDCVLVNSQYYFLYENLIEAVPLQSNQMLSNAVPAKFPLFSLCCLSEVQFICLNYSNKICIYLYTVKY